jgi:hypothetical protein
MLERRFSGCSESISRIKKYTNTGTNSGTKNKKENVRKEKKLYFNDVLNIFNARARSLLQKIMSLNL